ncbi:hypothetical protein [Pseudoduganella sp. UC29_71]|uniref:hypothetical protein n=1 Tax=Pseudoduganella sp. UC29_71 TaxID=3350174 RepID=UPI003672E6E4
MQTSLKDIFLSVLKYWPRRKRASAVPAQSVAARPPAVPLHLIGAAMGAQVDIDAVRAEMAAWMKATGQGKLTANPEFWRAVALATSAVRELAAAAGAHCGLAQPSETALPRLQLIALLPPEWKGPWRDAASRWLQHQLVSAGWPPGHIERNARRNQHPPQVLTALKHSTEPCLALLLACASQADEGAAALLLADGAQAALLGSGPYPLLQSVAEGREGQVAPTPAPGCALLRDLARQAMPAWPAPATENLPADLSMSTGTGERTAATSPA